MTSFEISKAENGFILKKTSTSSDDHPMFYGTTFIFPTIEDVKLFLESTFKEKEVETDTAY